MAENKVVEKDFTEEETIEQMRDSEESILEGLLAASDYVSGEEMEINVIRKGKTYFSFTIRPLSEEETADIRKKYTSYTRNRRTGVKVAEELDVAKFRSSIIYNSTIPEDREKIWNNKKLQEELRKRGKHIINALDVIDALLLPGEKSDIMDKIDELGGYNAEDAKVETAKNL